MLAAIGDIGQDFFGEIGELEKSMSHMKTWLTCWTTHMKISSTPGAGYLTKMGDFCTLLKRHPEAVESDLNAHVQISIVNNATHNCGDPEVSNPANIQKKLASALHGGKNRPVGIPETA